MLNRFSGLQHVYLQPGEFHITGRPELVSTVLGSCLSVTMFYKALPISAICHSLLPVCPGDGLSCATCPNAFKYVNCSIAIMAEIFDRHGISRDDIEVKLFGGAEMFSTEGGYDRAIGRQNVQAALEALSSENLTISASDTGGMLGRKLYFNTQTGEVFLQKIRKTKNQKDY